MRGESGEWVVAPPLAPFIEPAALLSLRTGTIHGYDLAYRIGDLIGIDKVDYGNLYRMLRRMEEEGLVTSVWDENAGGRSKRMYEITGDGNQLLTSWIAALEVLRDRVGGFLDTYHEGD